ncbi:unnamed protein product, partial [Darwinula stevensoni]
MRNGFRCPSTFNPADFFIHKLAVLPGHHESRSRASVKRICDSFLASRHGKEIDSTIAFCSDLAQSDSLDSGVYDDDPITKPRRKARWGVQVRSLLKRSLIESARNPAVNQMRTVQKIVLAILLGLVFADVQVNQKGIQDIGGAIFAFVTENSFPSMYGVLNVFPSELPVILREHQGGLFRVDAYYIAKMISLVREL